MGRGATKAAGNPWYEARIEAAKWNDKLCSRAGAAGEFGCSIDVIDRIETGVNKCMPVDMAVLMADKYNAPQLLNHYCLHECPIGRCHAISDSVLSIDRVTVKMLKKIRTEQLNPLKDKMLEIAEDGEVTEDEVPDLEDIVEQFEELSRTISELKIITKMALKGRQANG